MSMEKVCLLFIESGLHPNMLDFPGFPQALIEINQTWDVMDFSYEQHHGTGTPLLKSDESLIETLEDNQVKTHIPDWRNSMFAIC